MTVSLSAIHCLEDEPNIAKPLMRELRRADDFIRFAVAGVYETVNSYLPITDQQATHWGIIVGTSYGPMETNFDVLDQVVNGEQTSPTLFSHSVFNGAAGYLTRIFNIRGNCLTLTDFFYPFFQSLHQGFLAIRAGEIDRCIILQVETYSHLLHDARVDAQGRNIRHWPPGCVAWLLEKDSTDTSICRIDSIDMKLKPNWDHHYLAHRDTLSCNGKESAIAHPLAAAMDMSKQLKKPVIDNHNRFQLTSTNGIITIQFRK